MKKAVQLLATRLALEEPRRDNRDQKNSVIERLRYSRSPVLSPFYVDAILEDAEGAVPA